MNLRTMIIGCSLFLLLIFAASDVWFYIPHPSDQALTQNFQTREVDLNRLIETGLEDNARQKIGEGETTFIAESNRTRGQSWELNGTEKGFAYSTKGLAPLVASLDYFRTDRPTIAYGRVRERTFADYSDLLKRYVTAAIGNKRLSDVRPLDIQTLYNFMISPKLKKGEEQKPSISYGLGLSARSVRMLHAVLSSALKQAVKWHMLALNPCEAVELPRMERKEMQALSPEEASCFLEAARQDRFGVLFTFALATGMRPEEYLGLQWKDINFENGTATVRRTLLWRNGGGWYFDEPKTSRSRRTIPLPSSLMRALSEHRRRQVELRLKAGAQYQNNDFVFATGWGTPLMRRNLIRRHFRPILKRANLSASFRLYDLRHSCATLLLAASENPKVVSERLGHASIVLTLDTYSHVLPSMQQAATEKLESLLFKQTGTE